MYYETIFLIKNGIQMKKKLFIFAMTMAAIIFYACNKDDINRDNTKETKEIGEEISKEMVTNYLDDELIYLENLNLIKERKDGTRNVNSFNKEFKDFLAKHPKLVKKMDSKHGSIVWDRADVMSNDSFALYPVVGKKGDKVDHIFIVAKIDGRYEIVPRSRKNALKDKSLKQLRKKHEWDNFPREFLALAFLTFDKNLFNYTDCEMIDVVKAEVNLRGVISDSRSCHFIPQYTIFELWGYTYTNYYQTEWELLNTYYVTNYIFYCDGLNVGTENSDYTPNTQSGGQSLCANDPCNYVCSCELTQTNYSCDRCDDSVIKCSSKCSHTYSPGGIKLYYNTIWSTYSGGSITFKKLLQPFNNIISKGMQIVESDQSMVNVQGGTFTHDIQITYTSVNFATKSSKSATFIYNATTTFSYNATYASNIGFTGGPVGFEAGSSGSSSITRSIPVFGLTGEFN
jgi:hypothetical protein